MPDALSPHRLLANGAGDANIAYFPLERDMNPLSTLTTVALLLCLVACGGNNTNSTKTKALEAGASLLQDKPPIDALNAYLDGFHFYNGNMKGQMEAHHYCANLNEDLIQCVIYDGNQKEIADPTAPVSRLGANPQ
jgi:hypothetical protein